MGPRVLGVRRREVRRSRGGVADSVGRQPAFRSGGPREPARHRSGHAHRGVARGDSRVGTSSWATSSPATREPGAGSSLHPTAAAATTTSVRRSVPTVGRSRSSPNAIASRSNSIWPTPSPAASSASSCRRRPTRTSTVSSSSTRRAPGALTAARSLIVAVRSGKPVLVFIDPAIRIRAARSQTARARRRAQSGVYTRRRVRGVLRQRRRPARSLSALGRDRRARTTDARCLRRSRAGRHARRPHGRLRHRAIHDEPRDACVRGRCGWRDLDLATKHREADSRISAAASISVRRSRPTAGRSRSSPIRTASAISTGCRSTAVRSSNCRPWRRASRALRRHSPALSESTSGDARVQPLRERRQRDLRARSRQGRLARAASRRTAWRRSCPAARRLTAISFVSSPTTRAACPRPEAEPDGRALSSQAHARRGRPADRVGQRQRLRHAHRRRRVGVLQRHARRSRARPRRPDRRHVRRLRHRTAVSSTGATAGTGRRTVGISPYAAGFLQRIDDPATNQISIQQVIDRQTSRGAVGALAFPFNTSSRVELSGGAQALSFSSDVRTGVYYANTLDLLSVTTVHIKRRRALVPRDRAARRSFTTRRITARPDRSTAIARGFEVDEIGGSLRLHDRPRRLAAVFSAAAESGDDRRPRPALRPLWPGCAKTAASWISTPAIRSSCTGTASDRSRPWIV